MTLAAVDPSKHKTRLVLALLLWANFTQCDACGGRTLAELTTHTGTVDKQLSEATAAWNAADDGAQFNVGDALRTGAAATAGLRFFPDGQLKVEPETVIRFLDSPPEAPRRLQVENGQVEIEAVTEIDVATAGGVARVAKGSRVSVVARDRSTQIMVEVGSVEALDDQRTAGAGQRLTLEVGAVVAEDIPDDPEPKASAAAPQEEGELPDDLELGEPEMGQGDDGEEVRFLTEGTRPEFVIDGNSTVTVHDPRPPARVGFRMEGCAAVQIEVRRGQGAWAKAQRKDTAVAELSTGIYRFRGRCEGAAGPHTLRGQLSVREDSATRRLPTKAPEATVEADGRKYTVQYQNLLPTLRFTWPNAPPSDGYSLELNSARGTRRFEAGNKPMAVMRSGKLDEGTYTFRMRTAGGRSSLESSVRIAFDNAARIAYLSSPPDGSFERGKPARIVGAALAGAAVRSGPNPLRVSQSGRFEGSSTMLPSEDALVVQVQHPKSGTHYYLRYPR